MHVMSVMYDNLLKSADKGLYSCCLLLDLTEAFDSADHKIFIKKTKQSFGIYGISLELFENYLSCHIQYTCVNNSPSATSKFTCGVPQGSNLGPLLFYYI